MSRERAVLIEEIVGKRQERAEELRQLKPKWEELCAALESVENYRKVLNQQPELSVYLMNVDFSLEIQQIQDELVKIESLAKRLGRNTLNIGVLGRMGQGKSCLLQSITGLGKTIIPTSDQGICTSVLSKIYHRETETDLKVEVEFYSWTSFCEEVLNLYYEKLGLGTVPTNPEDFKVNSPPALPKNHRDENSRYLYGRLRKEYWQNFGHYESMLDGSSKSIAKEDLRRYVTQDDRDKDQNRLSYDDLAVKEVRIHCKFGAADEVGRVGLIDLPGLGDNNIYDVARLAKALRQEIDLLLFVRRPDSDVHRGWDHSDRELFKTARQTLDDFPISKCSYMVINLFRSSDMERNRKAESFCNKFKESIHQHQIEVKDTVIADCSDPQDIREKVLDPMLNYLVSNISILYDDYLYSIEQRLAKLQDQIKSKLNDASNVLLSYSDDEDVSQFIEWFEKTFFPALTSSLQKEVDLLERRRNTEDTEFKAKVIETMNMCRKDDVLPSVEEIRKRASTSNSSYKVAYYLCLLPVKLNLTRYLGDLNLEVERLLKQVRLSVADSLIEEAGLKHLTDWQGDEFLQEIQRQFRENYTNLKQGFEKLIKYPASKASPVDWVQSELDKLEPDINVDPISEYELTSISRERVISFWDGLNPEQQFELCESAIEILRNVTNPTSTEVKILDFITFVLKQILDAFGQCEFNRSQEVTKLSKAEQIRRSLNDHRLKVVEGCEKILEAKLAEPNIIAHSMVRQFKDEICSDDAKRYWQAFLTMHQDKVWDGAKDKVTRTDVSRRWSELVKFAIDLSSFSELQRP